MSALRGDVDRLLDEHGAEIGRARAQSMLEAESGVGPAAAFQIVHYLSDAKRVLGSLPTQDTLVLERFFDEGGGMQLVLHAPFGSRVNRAWGLSLRKRFCRQFNFELQAAATEEAVLLSLGPQHSFPLDDVFRFLASGSVRDVLIQALLDSPMFQTRWRWNATLSLALLRWRRGAKTPAQIQRMEAEDLLAAVFPDAAACLENIPGDRELPDHPLVDQTIEDCLTEAMDLPALEEVLRRLEGGELKLVARDTPEPSTLSAEVLNARPYSFLDDAPLEERRARAVFTRRALDPSSARELGALDEEAIQRVREQAWPDPGSPDELHDALLTSGFFTDEEATSGEPSWLGLLHVLASDGRAGKVEPPGGRPLWVATERLQEVLAVHPEARADPSLRMPARGWGAAPERDAAIKDLLRGRMDVSGPVTPAALGSALGVSDGEALAALYALEAEGIVLRGRFTPGSPPDAPEEWCERRLLARIHRYTLDRLRAEIQPVAPADFMRFLFRWHRVEPGQQGRGVDALAAVLESLDGCELPAVAWEADVLPARITDYDPELLDRLCLAGRVSWGRLSPPTAELSGRRGSGPLRSTRVALFLRASAHAWEALASAPEPAGLGEEARRLLGLLGRRGACFFGDLVSASGLLPTRVEAALGELAAAGLVTSDSFAGLRALLTPSDKRPPLSDASRGRGVPAPYGVDSAGRWALLSRGGAGLLDASEPAAGPSGAGQAGAAAGADARAAAPVGRPWERPEVERFARALLRRYGVVFRRLLLREPLSPPWRDLVMVYRALEARGEVRGGRFLTGFTGEQFALPEAVPALRAVRREPAKDELIVISAADPLNLTGVATPGERVPAIASSRVGYRAGVPVFVRERGEVRSLAGGDPPDSQTVRALGRRSLAPTLRAYVGAR